KETQNILKFYIRRIFRIVPAYWFVLCFLIFLTGKSLHNAWPNFLYINNYVPYSKQFMVWSWSLAVEAHFYLLFPILVLLIKPHKRFFFLTLVSLFVSSLFICYYEVVSNNAIFNKSIFEFHFAESRENRSQLVR